MNLDWDGAACKGRPELFFGPEAEPVSKQNRRESRAKTICARCPLQPACLEYALAERIEDGVWGGMTEAGRANLYRWRWQKASRDRVRERQAAA